VQQLAPGLRHAERRPEQGLGGGRAEQHQQTGPHGGQLGVEPRPAGGDLGAVRLLVDAHLAPGPELEVLDGVGHVDLAAVDAGGLEGPVEELPGGAHEGLPGPVLLVAGLLAHQHQPGAGRPRTEHGLAGTLVEMAAGAARRLGP
jgi:hypothetical protein